MSATIIDVARDCGYSKATVSRAFLTPDLVSFKARDRIYASSKKLNYSPNTIAQSMVLKRTKNIAFIIHEKQYPAILNPFYSPILETVLQEANRRNFSLLISTRQDMHLPNGKIAIKRQMDGVILAGEADRQLIKELQGLNIHVVLLNSYLEMKQLPCVVADHFQGAVTATQHLIDRGHRNIGLIAGRFSKQISEERLYGYLHALKTNGLSADPLKIIDIEPTIEEAKKAMTHLLKLANRPTAIFCTNDIIAAGAMKAVFRAKLRVPNDMALVGFDDSFISRIVEPELTSLRIDPVRMGQAAAEILFHLINGTTPDSLLVRLTPELIQREST